MDNPSVSRLMGGLGPSWSLVITNESKFESSINHKIVLSIFEDNERVQLALC
jgi:hypothetical protein